MTEFQLLVHFEVLKVKQRYQWNILRIIVMYFIHNWLINNRKILTLQI